MSSTASAISFESDIPTFVAQTRLLQHFAREVNGKMFSKEIPSRDGHSYFAQAECNGLSGVGRANTERLAHVKAVAEFYEHRLLIEAMSNECRNTPLALQTSNGFAVHLKREEASEAAKAEAIERHLLQLSFLKHGWCGFQLLKTETKGEETLHFVLSQYQIAGMRAGMVIAKSTRYAGLSFGYFAAEADEIRTSPRWSHAVSEALDKIDPFLKIINRGEFLKLGSIDKSIIEWMISPQEEMYFQDTLDTMVLPEPKFNFTEFDLKDRWKLNFPFYGSYCTSPQLLPLLISKRLKPADHNLIFGLCANFNLPLKMPDRNPIL